MRAAATALGRRVAAAPSDFRVAAAIVIAIPLATLAARAALGPRHTPAAVLSRFGFGLPAFEDGRLWTLLTGLPLSVSLSLLPPLLTVLGVGALEWKAGHVRGAAVFLGGHAVTVLGVAAVLWMVRDAPSAWLQTLARTLDVGSSNGAFACLGAWTAALRAPARRRWRLGIVSYLIPLLLIAGRIFDVTHLVGFCLGLLIGNRVARAAGLSRDRAPWRRAELVWLLVIAALAACYGVLEAVAADGAGGPFGWGR